MESTVPNEARTLSLEEIEEGQSVTEKVTMTAELVDAFVKLSGDAALAHVNDEHAVTMGYDGRLVHGFLVSLNYSRMLGMFLPGSNTIIHRLKFDALAPTYIGETLTYRVTVDRVVPSVKTVMLSLEATNEQGNVVNRGETTCTFRR